MGKIHFAQPVKLIISLITANIDLFEFYKEILIKKFYRTDLESNIQPFIFTKYYEKEFGKSLLQKLFSFESLVKPEQLSEIKKITNDFENTFTKNIIKEDVNLSKRKINIDPGYLSLDKFILASTKNGPARIYLWNGIYAEITLRFIDKTFTPCEYTYSNYKTTEYINFLNMVRQKYKLQISEYSNKF